MVQNSVSHSHPIPVRKIKILKPYKKDPDDHDRWIIDEEAAAVVRRIYQLIIQGYGPSQVARILTDKKIERPSYYKFHIIQ